LAKWQQYLDHSPLYRQILEDGEESIWKEKAEDYDQTAYPGDQKHIILSRLIPYTENSRSAIEIGAGPGTFTSPLSKRLERMTVVEPSRSMRRVLKKRLRNSRIDNVTIIRKTWQEVIVSRHDSVLALGCLYAFYEIDWAIQKMLRSARKNVLLLHLGGNGLWQIDYDMANALKIDEVHYFPPANLLVDVLVSMNLSFQMNVFPLSVEKRLTLTNLKQRYQKMFPSPKINDEFLETLLRNNPNWDGQNLLINEVLPFALIAIFKQEYPVLSKVDERV
jgi:hypothetical protein